MNIRWSILAVGVAATVVGFLLQSPGPVGKLIWPMGEGMPEPEGANMALLMLMGAFEAAAFGVGAAFLVAAWPWVKSNGGGSRAMSVLVYVAVGWMLMNWVPHTALHMAHGNITAPEHYGGLVAIEYGFHLTLILSGAILAAYAVRSVRVAAGKASTKASPSRTPVAR